jgi:phosphate transport system substrate-binding protein
MSAGATLAVARAGQPRVLPLPILFLLFVVACSAFPTPRVPVVQIEMTGSDSMYSLARTLADAYTQQRGNVKFQITATNSENGLRAAQEISGTIGLVAREIKPAELDQRRAVVIARDGVAVIVNKGNPINAISRAQLIQVFSGEIAAWPLGPSAGKSIVVISRENGSGTRDAFEKMAMSGTRVTRTAIVMPTQAAVVDYVSRNPESIGYTSMGALAPGVHALAVDDVPLSIQTVESNQYPFVRVFAFVIPLMPAPETKRFIDFVLSPDGQGIVGQRYGKEPK